MVATDIAARGIHVDGIDLVIHADPPAEHKAYAHRSGRTARAGADGVVVTMQTAAQAHEVRALMRKAGVTPQVAEADPDSAVVREIAGPPAPRVTLLHKAADLVQAEDRLSERPAARQPGTGRPGRGKPRPRPAGRVDDRGQRGQWGGRGRDWAPAGASSRGADGRSWGGSGAGTEPGSQRGGAGVRSGYQGRRSAGGNRRNSGQGRHS
jgi:superfamily II DNA/RNA helicase